MFTRLTLARGKPETHEETCKCPICERRRAKEGKTAFFRRVARVPHPRSCRAFDLQGPDPSCTACQQNLRSARSIADKLHSLEQRRRGSYDENGSFTPDITPKTESGFDQALNDGGTYTHTDPTNAPRHDLRTLRTLPDPDLNQDLSTADPDLSTDMTEPEV